MVELNVDLDWKRGRSPDATARDLRRFDDALDDELEKAMEEAVTWVEADAKRRAPVDTGTLRASIASIVEDDVGRAVKGYVGSNVEYAPFQEYGTRYMGAQPHLRPAFEKNRQRIVDRFEQAVDDAAERVF